MSRSGCGNPERHNRKHAFPDKSGSRKRTALFATFGHMTAFSESRSPQFSSMSSIGRIPTDSSGDACIEIIGLKQGVSFYKALVTRMQNSHTKADPLDLVKYPIVSK